MCVCIGVYTLPVLSLPACQPMFAQIGIPLCVCLFFVFIILFIVWLWHSIPSIYSGCCRSMRFPFRTVRARAFRAASQFCYIGKSTVGNHTVWVSMRDFTLINKRPAWCCTDFQLDIMLDPVLDPMRHSLMTYVAWRARAFLCEFSCYCFVSLLQRHNVTLAVDGKRLKTMLERSIWKGITKDI